MEKIVRKEMEVGSKVYSVNWGKGVVALHAASIVDAIHESSRREDKEKLVNKRRA